MGMLNRRTVLLGIGGIGAVALIADRSFVSDATAMTADLVGVVEDAKQASAIAQTLQSGDPVQIQDLLNRLVSEEGASPDETRPGLFGAFTSMMVPEGDVLPLGSPSETNASQSNSDIVSMIITTRQGGLAVVNGIAMQEGQTRDGVTLDEVHPDRVVLSDQEGARVVHLADPIGSRIGPSVAAFTAPNP